MARHLNTAAGALGIAAVAAACALHQPATAQILPDPTRPPAMLYAPAEDAAAHVSAGPVLQSVLISPQRTEAIISGQTVRVGDKVGGARVVRIAEGEVVLRNGNASQVLRLFPNIEKRTESRAGAEKRRQ